MSRADYEAMSLAVSVSYLGVDIYWIVSFLRPEQPLPGKYAGIGEHGEAADSQDGPESAEKRVSGTRIASALPADSST
jgi:hypothetical protein